MKTILTSENAIKAYMWLENFLLSAVIIFICLYLHAALIPLIGMWIAIRLRHNLEDFYRFVYSFLFLMYMLEIYIYIRDGSIILGMIGSALTLLLFMLLKNEQHKGKTL